MMVVAFYTMRTPYEQEIKKLGYSCVQHGLKYHFEGYENRGVWVLNCGIKPEFILEMLNRFPDEDLLYVDADAVFKAEPELIDGLTCDIAAYVMEGGTLLSGTIFFRNNKKVKELVNEWIKKQRKDSNIWDQKTLHETLVHHGPRLDIDFKELPREYCKIFDKDWGIPVIQHNQKSREFKEQVKMSIMDGVPAHVNNQRVTVHGDGSFTLPRNHREAEAYMDKHYRRVQGERRWFKIPHEPKNMDELRPIFKGKKCYIVGKGPSLDDLTDQAFEENDAPIIALNEAIHRVESLGLPNPIFALQQDMGLRDTCKPVRGKLFISPHAQHWYSEFLDKYVYDHKELGVQRTQLAVVIALEIAKKLGAKDFDLISFDACVNKETAYAKCIGHKSSVAGDPKRFLSHRKHISNHIKGYKVNWVIPVSAPSLTSLDKPSKPQVHPVTHHALSDARFSKSKPDMSDLSLKKELSRLSSRHDRSES